jgi:hypothetical protein
VLNTFLCVLMSSVSITIISVESSYNQIMFNHYFGEVIKPKAKLADNGTQFE